MASQQLNEQSISDSVIHKNGWISQKAGRQINSFFLTKKKAIIPQTLQIRFVTKYFSKLCFCSFLVQFTRKSLVQGHSLRLSTEIKCLYHNLSI